MQSPNHHLVWLVFLLSTLYMTNVKVGAQTTDGAGGVTGGVGGVTGGDGGVTGGDGGVTGVTGDDTGAIDDPFLILPDESSTTHKCEGNIALAGTDKMIFSFHVQSMDGSAILFNETYDIFIVAVNGEKTITKICLLDYNKCDGESEGICSCLLLGNGTMLHVSAEKKISVDLSKEEVEVVLQSTDERKVSMPITTYTLPEVVEKCPKKPTTKKTPAKKRSSKKKSDGIAARANTWLLAGLLSLAFLAKGVTLTF